MISNFVNLDVAREWSAHRVLFHVADRTKLMSFYSASQEILTHMMAQQPAWSAISSRKS